MNIEDRKCLAAWAVFKQLCDEGHKNIYEVLRDFVKSTIYRHSLRTFTAASLTEQVNIDYEFNVKTAVVAYALQSMNLQRDGSSFVCDPSQFEDEQAIDKRITESTKNNNLVIDGLYTYIGNNIGEELNTEQKVQVLRSLIHYLLKNSYEDNYSAHISAYLLLCRKDHNLSSIVDDITEGVVRYMGICFDAPVSASSRWTTEMTIFLDTEILFHMAGYNGLLYRQLFDDFYELVREINTDSKTNRQRTLIKLRYFDYVSEEIDKFFERAVDIVNNKMPLIPSVTAMKEITSGCKNESEVMEKKGVFLAKIKEMGILPDDKGTDFYQESFYRMNIEDGRIVKKFCEDYRCKNESDVQDALMSLSHVNVLRRGKSNRSFENLKYVLLTDNYITKRLSNMEEIRQNGDRPLCTDLYFITNRMWYRLGKAFGGLATPRVFDVISKAKIILSNQINNSVTSQYEQLVLRMDNHEISREGALEVLYQLRSQVKNPEEIETTVDVEQVVNTIGEKDLQRYIEESEYRKQKAIETEKENERLNSVNNQIKERNLAISKENETVKQENDKYKEENRRITEENVKKAKAIIEKEDENAALQRQVAEANRKRYETDLENYDIKMNAYVRKRRRNTVWLFAMYVGFLFISLALAFLDSKYCIVNINSEWIKIPLLLLVGQIIPLIRTYVTKINIVQVYKVIVRQDYSKFIEEYKATHQKPKLEE